MISSFLFQRALFFCYLPTIKNTLTQRISVIVSPQRHQRQSHRSITTEPPTTTQPPVTTQPPTTTEPPTTTQLPASEPRTLSSPTRTDLALQMANELFTVSKGDRSDKPNVSLVLTDGRPNLPRGEDFDYGLLDNINGQLKVLATWQWRVQGVLATLLFLDKNEARRAENMLGHNTVKNPNW